MHSKDTETLVTRHGCSRDHTQTSPLTGVFTTQCVLGIASASSHLFCSPERHEARVGLQLAHGLPRRIDNIHVCAELVRVAGLQHQVRRLVHKAPPRKQRLQRDLPVLEDHVIVHKHLGRAKNEAFRLKVQNVMISQHDGNLYASCYDRNGLLVELAKCSSP